jgi:hypothetical protein
LACLTKAKVFSPLLSIILNHKFILPSQFKECNFL